jgi:hypothetical protein
MAPRDRIAPALDAVLEGLKLARRELAASDSDPPRWRWVAVGLVSALQAGLVAALSGYESAGEADIADPTQPDRVAPVTLLLRRARSAGCLNPPERLELSGRALRDIEAVIGARNDALHGLGEAPEAHLYDAYRSVLQVLLHICILAPAFPATGHGVILALIRDEISALDRALRPAG